jgi:hypothetical protein
MLAAVNGDGRGSAPKKAMSVKKACRLAVRELRRRIQFLAVDGNLHELYGADYPAAIRAYRERQDLREAVEILERMANGD